MEELKNSNPHFPDGPSPIGTGFAHEPYKSGISCQSLLFCSENRFCDCHKCDLRVEFDRTVTLTVVGSKVTSDAGLLAYRELDEALGLTATAGKRLEDSRTGRNTRHTLLPLIRQLIHSRLPGYENVNDAERLCIDEAMRHIVGGRASQPEKMPASSSELGRFETEMLASRRNLTTLLSHAHNGPNVASNCTRTPSGRLRHSG